MASKDPAVRRAAASYASRKRWHPDGLHLEAQQALQAARDDETVVQLLRLLSPERRAKLRAELRSDTA